MALSTELVLCCIEEKASRYGIECRPLSLSNRILAVIDLGFKVGTLAWLVGVRRDLRCREAADAIELNTTSSCESPLSDSSRTAGFKRRLTGALFRSFLLMP